MGDDASQPGDETQGSTEGIKLLLTAFAILIVLGISALFGTAHALFRLAEKGVYSEHVVEKVDISLPGVNEVTRFFYTLKGLPTPLPGNSGHSVGDTLTVFCSPDGEYCRIANGTNRFYNAFIGDELYNVLLFFMVVGVAFTVATVIVLAFRNCLLAAKNHLKARVLEADTLAKRLLLVKPAFECTFAVTIASIIAYLLWHTPAVATRLEDWGAVVIGIPYVATLTFCVLTLEYDLGNKAIQFVTGQLFSAIRTFAGSVLGMVTAVKILISLVHAKDLSSFYSVLKEIGTQLIGG